MKKFLILLISFCLINISLASFSKETKFGAGIQNTPPQLGISGIYRINKKISLQSVVGRSIGGRFIYKFSRKENYNLYGYGGLSLILFYYHNSYYYDYYKHGIGARFGIGGGCGIEYNLKSISDDLPPIYTNIELGLNISKFYFPISLGIGFHYYFKN